MSEPTRWLTRTRPQPYWSLICFAVLVIINVVRIAGWWV